MVFWVVFNGTLVMLELSIWSSYGVSFCAVGLWSGWALFEEDQCEGFPKDS